MTRVHTVTCPVCGEIRALSLWNHLRLATTTRDAVGTSSAAAHEDVLRTQIRLAQSLFDDENFLPYSRDLDLSAWPKLLIEPKAVCRDIWPQLFTKREIRERTALYAYRADALEQGYGCTGRVYGIRGFRADIGHSANSTWEANVYRVLQYLGGRYQRELRFVLTGADGERLVYYVDILDEDGVLVPAGTFIEVKGQLLGQSWAKITAFRAAGHRLTIIGNQRFADIRYADLERTYRPKLPLWEYFGHNLSTHSELYSGSGNDHRRQVV